MAVNAKQRRQYRMCTSAVSVGIEFRHKGIALEMTASLDVLTSVVAEAAGDAGKHRELAEHLGRVAAADLVRMYRDAGELLEQGSRGELVPAAPAVFWIADGQGKRLVALQDRDGRLAATLRNTGPAIEFFKLDAEAILRRLKCQDHPAFASLVIEPASD